MVEVCASRTQGPQIPQGLVQGLLQGFTPLLLGGLLHVLEEDAAATLILHLEEMVSALVLLLSQFTEVAHTSRATALPWN